MTPPISHYLGLEGSSLFRLPPYLHPRNLELRFPVAFEMGMVTLMAVVIAAAWFTGVELRRWTWNYTRPIHFYLDIHNGFDNGAYGTQHGLLNVYDDQVAAHADDGDYRLDYAPIRLALITQWAAWRQERYPYLAYNQPEYDAFAPLLYVNTAMEFAAAFAAFFLVRHWVRRSTPMPKPRAGWLRGLLAALLLWFNPALILSGHAWPTWDLWILPFFLLALWLACADRWFWSGAVLAVGAMFKGQEIFVAPLFLLWPVFMLQPLRALRWIIGFAVAGALVLAPWLLSYLRDSVNPAAPHVRILDLPALLFVLGAAAAVAAAAFAARLFHPPSSPADNPDEPPRFLAKRTRALADPTPAVIAARKIAGGALSVAAFVLLLWPLLLKVNRGAVVQIFDLSLPLLPLGLGVVATVMLAAMLLPLRLQGLVGAAALAAALLSCAVLFHGNFNALRVGWLYGTRHYPFMTMGVSDNLAGILGARYYFHLTDDLGLPLIHLTVRQFLILLYALALPLCAVGMAVQEKRNDPRFLVAPVAAWLLFFCLLPQIHERYLLFAAVIASTLTAVSWGMTLLGLFLTAVTWIMTMHIMLENRDPALFGPHSISPAAVDRLYRFIVPTFPDLAWAVLLCGAIFLFVALSPRRRVRGA